MSVPDSLIAPDGDVSLDDARLTSFTFAGGGGTHFREAWLPVGYTDCGTTSEPVMGKSESKEVGVAIDHQASRRIHVGARAGYIWTDNTLVAGYDTTLTDFTKDSSYFHFDPYVAAEWTYFGVGIGGVFSGEKLPDGGVEELPIEDGDAQLTGHVRVGSLSSLYANASLWEGVPLLTTGHVVMGVGVRPVRPLELYGGYVSEGPYQTEAWMGRITVDANPNWSFQLNMRFPEDWNGLGDEYGTSLGVTYRIQH